jgi:RNA:NAD 2'-phosphotransferase (TPT1/KptA family)
MTDGRIRALYGARVDPAKRPAADGAPVRASLRQSRRPTRGRTAHASAAGASARECSGRRVNAADAANAGIAFYVGNEKVWLADRVLRSLDRDRRLKTWG